MGTYDRKTAEVIIKSRIGEFDVEDDGVRPKMVNIENMEFDSLINWTPLCELNAEDAPDPMSSPALPFPFTANQLAAFMLHGCGYFVREQFGDWADGPDPQAMAKLGTQATKAKQALKQTFAAYRAAEQVVGAYDIGYAERIQELESQYGQWPDDKEARRRIKEAHQDADDYEADRRNRMVNQLLKVSLVTDVDLRRVEQVPLAHPLETTTQTPATSAPVVAASDGPAPLTTGDIAHCFDGLHWSESGWRKPLGDKPRWLAECVAIPGQRGVSETRWNPVLIGASLVQQGHATARSVRAKFQSVELLKPWLEAWKTYEANNLETP